MGRLCKDDGRMWQAEIHMNLHERSFERRADPRSTACWPGIWVQGQVREGWRLCVVSGASSRELERRNILNCRLVTTAQQV